MAFTKAGKQKSNSGSPRNSMEPEETHEMIGLEPERPQLQDSNSVLLDYNGEKFLVSIRPVLPPNVVIPRLSVRESEVLQCLAFGLSPEQTAMDLNITTRTVRKHLDNLAVKLGTNSRDQMMARAGYLRLCNPYKEIS